MQQHQNIHHLATEVTWKRQMSLSAAEKDQVLGRQGPGSQNRQQNQGASGLMIAWLGVAAFMILYGSPPLAIGSGMSQLVKMTQLRPRLCWGPWAGALGSILGPCWVHPRRFTLWWTNIAMENHHCYVSLPEGKWHDDTYKWHTTYTQPQKGPLTVPTVLFNWIPPRFPLNSQLNPSTIGLWLVVSQGPSWNQPSFCLSNVLFHVSYSILYHLGDSIAISHMIYTFVFHVIGDSYHKTT